MFYTIIKKIIESSYGFKFVIFVRLKIDKTNTAKDMKETVIELRPKK